MTSNIAVEFPPGFEDYAWEVEAKGWIAAVVAVIDGRRYTITLYDPARLAQDISEELKAGRVFFEPNLVVVASTTRGCIAAAIDELVKSGRLDELRPDPA